MNYKPKKKEKLLPKILTGLVLSLLCFCFTLCSNPEIKLIDTSTKPSPTPVPIIFSDKFANIIYNVGSSSLCFCKSSLDSEIYRDLKSGEKITLLGIYGDTVKVRLSTMEIAFVDKKIIPNELLNQLSNFEDKLKEPNTVKNIFALAQGLQFNEKLELLKELFPNNTYWNHKNLDLTGLPQDWAVSITSNEPCIHFDNGIEFCHEYLGESQKLFSEFTKDTSLSFTSLCSDFLFNVNDYAEKFTDIEQLEIGDQIRDLSQNHSMIVIKNEDDILTVLECNFDKESCRISWERTLNISEMENCIFVKRISH